MGPRSVVIDKYGNIYVDEGPIGIIRKIDTNGIVIRYAGIGYTGVSSGDGGPATAAEIADAQSIAIDKYCNLFILDVGRIRKVTPNGIINTIFGVGNHDTCEIEGGTANSAIAGSSTNLAVDTNGNLLVPNNRCGVIYKLSTTGIVTKFAGTGIPGSPLGDEGPATAAGTGGNCGIWVDKQNQVYIADCASRIRMIDNFGIIHTIIGGGTSGSSPDGTAPIGASIGAWGGGCIGKTVYFGDDYRIRKVDYALDVPEISDTSVKCTLYPNPGNGTLHIHFPFTLSGSAYVKLYTATGALAYETAITQQDATVETSLSAGTYALQITYKDKLFRGKVVVR